VIQALFKKAASFSIRLVLITAGLGIAYGFIDTGAFTLTYAFYANFRVGIVILIAGLITFFFPTVITIRKMMKKTRLIDHTTYREKFTEESEGKRIRSYELMYIGMFILIISGFIQVIVWFILRSLEF
jgi:hypothetical protein